MTTWQQHEADADAIREAARPARHLATTPAERRARRFWPIAFPTILTAGITLAAAIQGGALHV